MNGRKSKPDAGAWKNGVPKKQEIGAGASGLSPHRAYVPPALAGTSPSALKVESKPDLPQKLVDEFKA